MISRSWIRVLTGFAAGAAWGTMGGGGILGSAALAQEVAPEHYADAYQDWQVAKVTVRSSRDLMTLTAVGAEGLSCTGAGIGQAEYALEAKSLPVLDAAGIPYVITIHDLEAFLEAERARIVASNQQRGLGWFADYKDTAQISAKVDELVALRPDIATRFVAGTSLEGRDIFGIRISSGAGEKPGIILHGLQHAREWVTGMTAMYSADRLVRTYDSDANIRALIDHFEIYIIPIMNADGYAYTWTPNNRLWRKNRRPNADGTFGVDLNRNWGYQWGPNSDGGSSGTPNSETYRGTAAFSEPETQVMRDFIIAHPRIVFHVDIHSYGQLILSPYGYSSIAPPDAVLFDALNVGFADAVFDVHGRAYAAGPTFSTIYPANGVSQDWSYAIRGVLGWGVECRGTSFELPAAEILPNCEEVWAGMAWVADWLRTHPLLLSLPGGAPEIVVADQPTPIIFAAARGAEPINPFSIRAFARAGATGDFASVPVALGPNNTFTATLPAAPCGQVIQYYFQAAAQSGAIVTLPDEGAAAPFASTAASIAIALDDNAETNLGWSLGVAGDTATSGQWVRADPNGTTAQPEDDHSVPGVACFFTGQGTAGGAAGQADVDGGRTTLLSPPLNLAGGVATISYWRWYSNGLGGAPNADVFTVDLSNDNGANWTRAETIGPGGPETNPGWNFHEIRVNDLFPTPSSTVRIRFVADDAGQGSLIEAAVDDFRAVVSAPCPPPACPADWDGSGAVNSQDFFDFIADFFADNADFNASGQTDSQDFFDFVSAFFVGC